MKTFLTYAAAIASGGVLALVLFAATACWFVGASPESPTLPGPLTPRFTSLGELLAQRPAQAVLGIDEVPAVPGMVTVVAPVSRCSVPTTWPPTRQWLTPWQGLPAFPFANHFARCVAGKEFLLYWWTHNSTWIPGREAPAPAALLVSLRPRELPEALDSMGMTGCWLQVHPDLLLSPTALTRNADGTRMLFGLVREPSRLVLWWTPPSELIGLTLYTQCVVAEPGVNQAGLLISPLVTFTIGNS